MDLYRSGQFTTQKSWLWCTAAGVQIVRNMVESDTDHRTASQRTYFDWMRRHNRYTLPESAGVDPAGWTAGLRHFVDDRYRLVASRSFGAALRSAVTRMRLTGLPVALTVANGGHGWILSGFSATADPAATTKFEVTSVRVVGPLYGLPEQERVRHEAGHVPVGRPVASLLHALALRPEADGLGRALRVDPAGAGEDRGGSGV